MDTPREVTGGLQEVKGNLENVARALDSLAKRTEEVMTELARIKESQNEVLAGLALYERARRLKESMGLEQPPPPREPSPWDEIQAYCRNCTRMMPIIEPTAVFQDGRTTVRARCRSCGTMVLRTLS